MDAINLGAICIPHLSSFMKNNKKLVLAAIKTNPYDLKYIKNNLIYDKDILTLAITTNSRIIELPCIVNNESVTNLLRDILKDEEILLKCVKN